MKNLLLLITVTLSQIVTGQNVLDGVYMENDRISPELLWKLGRVAEPRLSPDGKQVTYSVTSYDIAANKGQTDIYIIPVSGGEAKAIASDPATNESSARWRPDGKRIGYIAPDKDAVLQVWEMNADGSDKKKLTSVTTGINQFGYSASMDQLWYTSDIKLDRKPNEIYPDLPKTENARIIDGLMYRHWSAWEDYAYSHVFSIAYANGEVTGNARDWMLNERYDSPLQPFGGDEQITFSSDGKRLAYTCKKENGTAYAISTNSEIYIADLTTSKTLNASEGMPGYDKNPVFSPDGKKMIWLSMEMAGYESDRNRIYIYDMVANTKKELLSNFDYSVEAAVFSPDGNKVYFIAGINATQQLFSFDLNPKSAKPLRQITSDVADYEELSVSMFNNKPVIVTSRMSITMPAELYMIDDATGKAMQLTHTNAAIWDKVKKPKVEKRMVKTSDGKDMLTWVIYPPDFNPAKKYPAVLFCQGGPQNAVSQFFSYRWNFALMASKDYIVVAPNRRGLPSFGEAWNDEITGDWGGQAMTDLLSAIDDVSKESYVDKDHLGAVGPSFGGYSVYWLAGHHNKRFKAFIAHCGVFNLESEYGATEEIFFSNHDMGGSYWQQPAPKSYDQFSPIKFVKNWDTPILIIHNEKDFRVPLNQGMEAFSAAQLQGIPSRFLYFPDEGHWVLKPQNSILWQRVFFEWLDKYLKK